MRRPLHFPSPGEFPVKKMACDCAAKAGKDEYRAVALGNWEECHADKTSPDVKLLGSQTDAKCFNAHFLKCKSGESCMGEQDYIYIYALPAKDGNWGDWSNWSGCGVTCGNGVHKRTRKCDNPAPEGGGKDCEGEAATTKPCSIAVKCPIDGKWSEWSEWESCDKCCGGGNQRRYRTCDNPPPGPNGKDCQGERIDSRKCNTNACRGPESCFFKYTQYMPYDKDRSPIFLDNHQIKCPTDHVLNYIRLQENGQSTGVAYGYRCCKTQPCSNSLKMNNPTSNGGGFGKIFNLDRQIVDCKNQGLSSLKLDEQMSSRWNYKYDCCKVPNKKLDCYRANTGFMSNMAGNIQSLLNHEISCKCDDYYITGFKLNQNYNGNRDQIRYDFQCCKIKN